MQTVTGKGYRFVAQVVEHIEEEEDGAFLPTPVEAVPQQFREPLQQATVLAVITAVLVVAAAMIYFLPSVGMRHLTQTSRDVGGSAL